MAELPEAVKADLRMAGLLPRLIFFVDVKGGAGTARPSLGRAALVDVFASRRPN